MRKIKVLIVDDSATVRKVLSRLIENEPDMEVAATAPNPYVARDKLVLCKPDVMTLDIEMPKMDGLTFLSKVMHYFPIPTVVVSSVTKKGSQTTIKAMELGAVSVIPKPSEAYSIESIEGILIDAIRAASIARVKKTEKQQPVSKIKSISITTTNKILAIGASTGGTEAIKEVLTKLPANSPGIVIVQHMPPVFTTAYAERLNSLCEIEVKEAQDGDALRSGLALLAPGDFHMVLRREGARYFVRLKKGPMVWHQRPAVDVLFKSVAEYAGKNAVGIILTGMGKDGAKYLKVMRENGAITIAQSEKTCVVFGMPKEAIDQDAVDYIEDLKMIPKAISDILSNKISKN